VTHKLTINDLSSYHRSKVLERAHRWRMEHHKEILEKMTGQNEKAEVPSGAAMFDPERWTVNNWVWFRPFVQQKVHNILRMH